MTTINQILSYYARYKVGPLMNLKRATSMPTNLSNDDSDQFKAKPFPKAIFKDYAYEQIRENERYRDVRKALRQKALLSAAKLPPRMQKLQEERIGIDKKVLKMYYLVFGSIFILKGFYFFAAEAAEEGSRKKDSTNLDQAANCTGFREKLPEFLEVNAEEKSCKSNHCDSTVFFRR